LAFRLRVTEAFLDEVLTELFEPSRELTLPYAQWEATWDQRIRVTRATMTARVPWTGAGQIQKHHVVRRGFSASSPTADRNQVLSFSDELGRTACGPFFLFPPSPYPICAAVALILPASPIVWFERAIFQVVEQS
jgi:hypothetical protein